MQTALNAKQDFITAGSAMQYWRGDKTWQTFDAAARTAIAPQSPLSFNASNQLVFTNPGYVTSSGVPSIATNNGITGGTITGMGTIGLAMRAANTMMGNNTGSAAVPVDMNQAAVRTFLGLGSLAYLGTNASTSQFLRGDGTWQTPSVSGSYLPLAGGTMTGAISWGDNSSGDRILLNSTFGGNDGFTLIDRSTASDQGGVVFKFRDDSSPYLDVEIPKGYPESTTGTWNFRLADGSGNATIPNSITAARHITSGGTSSQVVQGDGSVASPGGDVSGTIPALSVNRMNLASITLAQITTPSTIASLPVGKSALYLVNSLDLTSLGGFSASTGTILINRTSATDYEQLLMLHSYGDNCANNGIYYRNSGNTGNTFRKLMTMNASASGLLLLDNGNIISGLATQVVLGNATMTPSSTSFQMTDGSSFRMNGGSVIKVLSSGLVNVDGSAQLNLSGGASINMNGSTNLNIQEGGSINIINSGGIYMRDTAKEYFFQNPGTVTNSLPSFGAYQSSLGSYKMSVSSDGKTAFVQTGITNNGNPALAVTYGTRSADNDNKLINWSWQNWKLINGS
jgi:hypothetical protein